MNLISKEYIMRKIKVSWIQYKPACGMRIDAYKLGIYINESPTATLELTEAEAGVLISSLEDRLDEPLPERCKS
jgi:hypothetical protein